MRKLLLGLLFGLVVVAFFTACQQQGEPKNLPSVSGATDADGPFPGIPRSLADGLDYRLHPLDGFRAKIDRLVAEGVEFSSFHGPLLKILDQIEIHEGDVIADIGCGTGQLSIGWLERRVPLKKLYAVDINKQSLELLQYTIDKARLPGRERVETVVAGLDDLRLPAGEIDVAVVVNLAFYVDMPLPDAGPELPVQREKSIASLVRAIKPGGRVHAFQPSDVGKPLPLSSVAGPYENGGLRMVSHETIFLPIKYFHLVLEKPRDPSKAN